MSIGRIRIISVELALKNNAYIYDVLYSIEGVGWAEEDLWIRVRAADPLGAFVEARRSLKHDGYDVDE